MLLVDKYLYTQQQSGSDRYSQGTHPQQRFDPACEWILSDTSLEDWLVSPSGALTMFGDMGCGKTATASFVAEHLERSLSQSRAAVITYYCRQEETLDLRTVYCSFVYQLLQENEQLKKDFREWFNKLQAERQGTPTDDISSLTRFLQQTIKKSIYSVYVVVDGLDELEEMNRKKLLSLFRDLIRSEAPLKAFLSSREKDDIQKTLGQDSSFDVDSDNHGNGTADSRFPLFHIDMKPTERRDELLARHLATQLLDETIRDTAVSQLSPLAKGSAVWLEMAMRSLEKTNEKRQMEQQLAYLKTNPSLVKLYWDLFVQAAEARCVSSDVVETALETLAVARRPLTVQELSYAVVVDHPSCSDLTHLDATVQSLDLLVSIGPFVSITERDSGQPVVRLIHQSLLELVMEAPPSLWGTMAEGPPYPQPIRNPNQLETRKLQLHATMAGRCAKYLLQEDFNRNLFLRGTMSSTSSPESSPDLSSNEDTPKLSSLPGDDGTRGLFRKLDIYRHPNGLDAGLAQSLGCSLPFYHYAALHWAEHFTQSEEFAGNELREAARRLICTSSHSCANWVKFYRIMARKGNKGFPAAPETITLVSYFNMRGVLVDVLQEDRLPSRSALNEALFWGCRAGHDHVLTLLLLAAGADPNFAIHARHTALHAAAKNGHAECVWALISRGQTHINMTDFPDKRTPLSYACSHGHLDVVQELLKRHYCRPDREDNEGNTPFLWATRGEHVQIIDVLAGNPGVDINHRNKAGRSAVYVAARDGGGATLRRLLSLEGIDCDPRDEDEMTPLLLAVSASRPSNVATLIQDARVDKTAADCYGKNAFHLASKNGKLEIVRLLLEGGVPGIDQADVDGWTPLMWAVRSSPEVVESLLSTGRVDVHRRDLRGKTALYHAIADGGNPPIVRLLLCAGADLEAGDDDGVTPIGLARRYALHSGEEAQMFIEELEGSMGQR